MSLTRVTVKGQVTVPKEVRQDLGLHPGDKVRFIKTKVGYLIRKEDQPSPFRAYRGYLKEKAGCDPDELVKELRGE